MTFRKSLFSGKVVSSDGYSVKPLGHTRLLYEDGANRLYVSGDLLGPNRWAIYPEDMRKDNEQGRPLRDDTLRELVTRRIRDALEFLGGSLEI
jgi:hypothetical protein